jgi:hypothetical protein
MDMKQKLQNETAEKRIYTPPRLVAYGDVRSLTQAGTQGVSEAPSNSPNKKA